ncbi:restriction endonuclease [Photobacterium indicum]|uniref:Restriction endonuclease n=1 Tax=Photobacterium indicum TaxID=81447 RepID=A0A2T3LER7_9GAMM|nr:restriction endonuclease [Photobacterium indicum]PSV49865.1 restriction endonuclease [Photobacterium indicum]
MSTKNKDYYLNKIKLLESGNLPPIDAERILGDVITPLLNEEGYEIKATPMRNDGGVDFIGSKNQEKIAIEYKHYKGPVGAEAVRNLIGASVLNNFDRTILVTNSRFSNAALQSAQKNLPFKLELIDVDSLRSWIDRVEKTEDYDLNLVNILRRDLSDKLARCIAENPRYLDDIEWRELERVVQHTFEELGFSSEVTPGSKDGGKDVILKCKVNNEEHTYYVELKHWRSGQKVGGVALKEFLQVVINEEVNGGLFLSSYGYCANAFEMLTEIHRQPLRIGGQEKIYSLCKQYVMSKAGIWSQTDSLIDTLYENTTLPQSA